MSKIIPEQKEKMRELGVAALRKLNILPDYVKAFAEKGVVTNFLSPFGSGYYEEEEGMREIREVEELLDCVVYATISGVLAIQGERMSYKSFIVVTQEHVRDWRRDEKKGANIEDAVVEFHSGVYGYRVYTYTKGWFDEAGSICVKPVNGGLCRTC